MAGKITPVIVVDIDTNEIVAEFVSQAVCRDLLSINHRPVLRKERGTKPFGRNYVIKYKEETIAQVVYTPKAWYCEKHEVWIAKGMECPLCVLDNKK